MKLNNQLETLVELLCNHTTQANNNELLIECLPSIPNVATNFVTLQFSGWKLEILPDGTWSVKDTGGCLKKN